MDLGGRLKWLIDKDFAGNLNRAAKAWGVPQPTLYRYVHGPTEEPKARTVQRVASYYGTTVAWLLDGTGPGPVELPYPIVEFRAWETVVRSLKLPAEVEPLVEFLPTASLWYSNLVLCDWGLMSWKGKRVSLRRRAPAIKARALAGALLLEAWAEWMRGLVTAYGRTAVRNKLLSELDRLRLGFQPFACSLLDMKAVPGDLEALYRKYSPDGQPRTLVLDEPNTPPLNAARGRQPTEYPATEANGKDSSNACD